MIWEFIADSDNFDSVDFINKEDVKLFIDHFKGERFTGNWIPLNVKYTDYRKKPHSDFPSLTGTVPIFSERALQILFPLIEKDVEVLELNTPVQKLYLINVINKIDCLDREKSELFFFSNGAIKNIKNITFKEEKIGNSHIFKMPEWRVRTYVSDVFKETVIKNNLVGIKWTELK